MKGVGAVLIEERNLKCTELHICTHFLLIDSSLQLTITLVSKNKHDESRKCFSLLISRQARLLLSATHLNFQPNSPDIQGMDLPMLASCWPTQSLHLFWLPSLKSNQSAFVSQLDPFIYKRRKTNPRGKTIKTQAPTMQKDQFPLRHAMQACNNSMPILNTYFFCSTFHHIYLPLTA